MNSTNLRWICAGLMAVGVSAVSMRALAEDKEKDEKEVKVKIEEMPKAVQKTLKREAGGVKLETVDKQELKGKTVYEADAKIDGHNYEIIVAEDGTLVSKKLDEEEDAKPDAGKSKEKDEKDEKAEKK